MYQFDIERAQNNQTAVHLLCACIILLTGIGLVVLYSSSYAYSQRFMKSSNELIIKQAIIAGIGLILFFLLSRINLEKTRKFIFPLLMISALLCVMAILPGIGVEKKGASRWIQIGTFSYQPSEMVKLLLPVYLAHILDKKEDHIDSFNMGLFGPVIITGIFVGLIYAQNNFSTAVLIMVNTVIIFLFAGIRYRYLASLILVAIPITALLVFTREYRVLRILNFIRPELDPMDSGFQIRASRLTIISGGFWGKGIGQGTRKIASVPEVHSDFVFSAFVEEMGYFGIILFFLVFTFFAVLGYQTALKCTSTYKRLLAGGLTTMIITQTLLNIATVSGALPATGVPLPFFSAGGSSLLTTLACTGFIVNAARNGDKTEIYNDR
jgi:cell division protein FtsW